MIFLEQEVLFSYATYGLQKAKLRFEEGANEQVREILDYISTVENFKKMKEPQDAAKALALELHNIERAPSHLLRSQEVSPEQLDLLGGSFHRKRSLVQKTFLVNG